uniref:Uncharacterized protein n=1 Tax=Ursus americanus TaxID=9643 RepID=A0A452SCF8_URSAM
MTCGNQHELTRQKNMKMRSDWGKGRHRDDRLSAAACKRRAPSCLPHGLRLSGLEKSPACGGVQDGREEGDLSFVWSQEFSSIAIKSF